MPTSKEVGVNIPCLPIYALNMRPESACNFDLTTNLLAEIIEFDINLVGNRSSESIAGRQSSFLARTGSDDKKDF